MALISEAYREQNRRLHEQNPNYGASAAKNAKATALLLRDYTATTVLDYGCGKRGLQNGLRGLKSEAQVSNYDPAIPECSSEPEPAHIVVCADVLEHIEPECLDDVLAHICSLMQMAGLFVIACREAKKTLPDGRNTHLIVQPPAWWLHKIAERFMVRWSAYRPDFAELRMIVEPK